MERKAADYIIRFIAFLIDRVIVFALVSLPIIWYTNGVVSEGAIFLNWLLTTVYWVVLPIFWNGYLIGKRFLKIRVVTMDDQRVTFGKMIIREVLGSFLYLVTFGALGILSVVLMIIRQDGRGLHDLMAGTYVTNRPPAVK